jgi:hypothetical protein
METFWKKKEKKKVKIIKLQQFESFGGQVSRFKYLR